MPSSLPEATRASLEKMKGYQSELASKYEAQGERKLLLRQLRVRFGEIPEAARARVAAADVARLERWGERVLTAKTLDEVLDEPS